MYVQSAFTYLWQIAAEQRDIKRNPRPIFWVCDEAHELICSYTSQFLATARSARIATVLITQNKSNYLAAMGGEAGRHHVDACLSLMGTLIGHANGSAETNRWMSDVISEELQARTSWQGTMEEGKGKGGGSETIGRKVLPSEFTMLKKGGAQSEFMTEAIVYQTGASFTANNGEPWLRTAFKQQIPGVTIKNGKR